MHGYMWIYVAGFTTILSVAGVPWAEIPAEYRHDANLAANEPYCCLMIKAAYGTNLVDNFDVVIMD